MLMASRLHGDIQYGGGNFKYTDESTNGTWVLQNGGEPIRIHRESMVLQGEGQITFGEPDFSNINQLLQYQIVK